MDLVTLIVMISHLMSQVAGRPAGRAALSEKKKLVVTDGPTIPATIKVGNVMQTKQRLYPLITQNTEKRR
jgi:hypothetical protein